MKTYTRNPRQRFFMILGVLLTLTLAVTLSVIVVMNYASTDASAQTTDSCDGAQTWTGIVPDCLSPGDTYRIIFVTSGERDATSPTIADYNAFVQTQAVGTLLADITFNALGSTETVDARDNTMTTGAGERIFYYDGRKVADDYADLYDGTWDTNEPRNQNGSTISADPLNVWTGSTNAGEAASTSGGAARSLGSGQAAIGNAKDPADPNAVGPILTSNSSTSAELPLYALSEVLTVPGSCDDEAPTWTGIIPDCLSPGDSYRILFLTSDMRDATSTDIADYNTFVQGQADGVTALNGITFRVLASTGSTDARDNTMTTGAGANIRIFYYQGAKAADDYTDLYDGNWDTSAARHQNGALRTGLLSSVWTGTNEDGTGNSGNQLGTGNPRIGNADVPVGTPLDDAFDEDNAMELFFYALSDVLTVPNTLTLTTAALTIAENTMPEFTISFTMGTSPEPVQVEWGVDCGSDAGIVSADDFSGNVCPTGTITIDTDRNSSDPFSIPLMDDTLLEGNETLRLRLLTTAPMAFNGNDIQIGDAFLNYNITDNDEGVVSVTVEGSSEILEGDAPTITFNVDLSGGVTAAEDIVVSWATACVPDNAVGISAADFMGGTNPCDGGTVTIASGGTSATFTVQIVDDTVLEGNEDFTVSLTDISVSTNIEDIVTISDTNGSAGVTIMDDDTPVITISTATSTVNEGSDAIFTFTLGDTSLTEDVDLVWNIADCSAAATAGIDGFDFDSGGTCPSGTVTLPMTGAPNNIIGMVEIPVIGDNLIEGPETFQLQVVTPPALIITNTNSRSDIVTITDAEADSVVMLGPETTTAADEGAAASFTVSFPPDIMADETVAVSTMVTCLGDITAADFVGSVCGSGSIIIPARMNAATLSIDISDDNLIEGDETFTLELTSISSGVDGANLAVSGTSNTATRTIMDSDNGVVTVTVEGSSEVSEGDTPTPTITFNVGLTGEGSDKTADEDIEVTWSIGAPCGSDNAAGITADDFTTATNPCNGGTVTIDSGGNSATFTVEIANDTTPENSEEFTVSIRSVSVSTNIEGRVTISDTISKASVTITDDDAAVIAISTVTSTVDEGSDAIFTFTLGERPLTRDVNLVWNLMDVDGGNIRRCINTIREGTNGPDFGNVAGCSSGQSGRTTLSMTDTANTVIGMVEIPIRVDSLIEGPEMFLLEIDATASMLGDPPVLIINDTNSRSDVVTINDEEASDIAVTVSTETVSTADENVSTAVFRVSLPSGITADADITVNWAVTCLSDGSPGITAADFGGTCPSSQTVITSREGFSTFAITTIADDNLIEGNEELTLRLTSAGGVAGASLTASDTASYTIEDNDRGLVSISTTAAETSEMNAETIRFNVNLTGVGSTNLADEDIGVTFTPTCVADNGLGITSDDFTSPQNLCDGVVVTIAVGTNIGSLDLTITNDDVVEDDEILISSISLTGPNFDGLVTVGSPNVASLTIEDDDAPRLNRIESPASVDEGSTIEFTFNFDKPLPADVTLAWFVTGCSSSRAGLRSSDFSDTATADIATACPRGTVSLMTGETSGAVNVAIRTDSLLEGSERFWLRIDEVRSTLGRPQALRINDLLSDRVTINDRDRAEVSLYGPSTGMVTEGATALFRVNLRRGGTTDMPIVADRDISVGWRIGCVDGSTTTAAVGDFSRVTSTNVIVMATECPSGTVTIREGESEVGIDVPTFADTDPELMPESFEVSLRSTVDVVGYDGDYSATISSLNGVRKVFIVNNVRRGPSPTIGSSKPRVSVEPRSSSGPPDEPGPAEPVNADDFVPMVSNAEESVGPAPRGVIFVPGSIVDISIGGGQEEDAFYDDSQVCLSITEEARRAVRGRVVSLTLYHYDATDGWEKTERSRPDSREEKICGTVDNFSPFALGYPAPIERSNLSILLPPTGGVTLSLWVLFGSGLLGLAVVSGGVFGLRRRR